MGEQIMDDLTVQLQRASNCIVNRYCERYKVALESGVRKVAEELKKKDRNKSVSKADVISIIEKIETATINAIPIDFEEDVCEEARIYAVNDLEDETQFEEQFKFSSEKCLQSSLLQPRFHAAGKQVIDAVFSEFQEAINQSMMESEDDNEDVEDLASAVKQMVSGVHQKCTSLNLNTIKLLQQVKILKKEQVTFKENPHITKLHSKSKITDTNEFKINAVIPSSDSAGSSSPTPTLSSPNSSPASTALDQNSKVLIKGTKRKNLGVDKAKGGHIIDLTGDVISTPNKRQKAASNNSLIEIDLTIGKEKRSIQTEDRSCLCSKATQTEDEMKETNSDSDPSGQDPSPGPDNDRPNAKNSNAEGSNAQGSNEQGSNEQGSNEHGSKTQESNEQGSNEQESNVQGSNVQESTVHGSNVQESNANETSSLSPSTKISLSTSQMHEKEISKSQSWLNSDLDTKKVLDQIHCELFESLVLSNNPEALRLAAIPPPNKVERTINLSEIIQKGFALLKEYSGEAKSRLGTIICNTDKDEFEKLFIQGLTQDGEQLILRCVNGDPPIHLTQPLMDQKFSTSVMLLIFKKRSRMRSAYICLSVESIWKVAEKKKYEPKDCQDYYLRGPLGFGNEKPESVICIPLWRRSENWANEYAEKMRTKKPKIYPSEVLVKNYFALAVKCLFVALLWTNQNDQAFNDKLHDLFPGIIPFFVGLNYQFPINQSYDKLQDAA